MSNPENPNPSKKQIADDMKAKAEQASREVKTKGREQLEAQESRAADKMDRVAEATDAAADELARREETAVLSHYVSELADGIGSLSSSLRQKNTDELIHDANRLARNNAGLFLLGSVAIGFGLSRIAKANRPPSRSERHWEDYYGQQDTRYYGEEAEEATASARSSSPGTTHASTSYLPEETTGPQTPITPPSAATRSSPSTGPSTGPGEST